jgi:two-component system response regulator
MNGQTILLVEDNSSDEELTILSFKKIGIENQVIVVRDGAEAVDYLSAQGAYVDRDPTDVPRVVFLDLNLPKMGGLDVLRWIRENAKTRLMPVVILSSSKEDRDLIDAYHSGANSYLTKSVEFARYSEDVNRAGYYWTVLNQTVPTDR